MRWFEGSIPAAINSAKQQRSVFVIFISKDDETSKNMSETWESEGVTGICNDANMVAMKLSAESESCKQFSQIYPVVCMPVSFFIGNNGVPLEVVGGHLSVEEFIPKIEKVIEMHKKSLETSSAAPPPPQQPAAAAAAATTSTSQETTSAEPLEDRVAKAKVKIDEKKQMKEEQAKQESIRKEMERRKIGQQVQVAEQKRKETEAKQVADELKKQRAEDRAAKERIRQQIAQDRAERAARIQQEKEERELMKAAKMEAKKAEQEVVKQQQEQAKIHAIRNTADQLNSDRNLKASKYQKLQEEKETAKRTALETKQAALTLAEQEAAKTRMESTRIQFRLPDGSSIMHTFPSESPLATARKFLYDHIGNTFGQFTLSAAYPRRRFSETDMQISLLDLELVPSASLIVLPGSKSLPRPNSGGGGGIFSLIFAPFMWIWSFVVSIFSSPPPIEDTSAERQREEETQRQQQPQSTSQASSSSSSSPRPQEENTSRPARPKSSYMRRRTAPNQGNVSRQEGNIHRFSTHNEDSDDENATWNGNSTQQM
ncbi:UBX domain-containing protein 4-like isoform X1 [Glandiceps talaboti]